LRPIRSLRRERLETEEAGYGQIDVVAAAVTGELA